MNRIRKTVFILIPILLCGLLVWLGTDYFRVHGELEVERKATPTPRPVYGNVLSVTRDPSAPTDVPVLKNGSVGLAVLRLQEKLTELGYFQDECDGSFGPKTESALREFQSRNGLSVDGIAGARTHECLYSEGAIPWSATPVPTMLPSPTPVPTDSGAVVMSEETRETARKMYVTGNGYPLLVNRTHLLPDDYEPYDLVVMNDVCDPDLVKIKYRNTRAEREAVDALLVMLSAARDEGIGDWQISAAYRTLKEQQNLFDNKVSSYMKSNNMSRKQATSATRKTVADPGSSEHHLGTCFDITVPGKSFAGTKQAAWLKKNCWDYGFILRYAEDKEKITGFLAEAWHYRYVGTEHARIMRDGGLCLEEYLAVYAGIL